MKNYFKKLCVILAVITLGTANVNAETATRQINKNACETVYTNYYLFLDANTTSYFANKDLSTISHSNGAEYYDNYYAVNFDSNNVGYGQVKITKTSTTSSDGITSMSLEDYYSIYLKTSSSTNNGIYTKGYKTYYNKGSWYRVSNNTWTKGEGGVDVTTYAISTLKNASLDANATITRLSSISYSNPSPFTLQIDRTYTGTLTGSPISYGNYEWYLHPAMYYVQYCSTATNKTEYEIDYDGNGDNVTNVPSNDTYTEDECTTISTKTPKRTGYTFLGWSTDKNATKADSTYAAGSEVCKKNLTLYAVWKKNENTTTPAKNTYKIEYDGNGDNVVNVPSDVTYEEGTCVNISSVTPVREGYTFVGWSTDKSDISNDTKYTAKEEVCNKNLKLYAIWSKTVNTYTITYLPNTTDTVTNMPDNETLKQGDSTTISSLTPVRDGYTFVGWSTDKDATSADSAYAAGSAYTDGKDLVLYAIWQKKTTITNPQTGIMDYLAPVLGVISASGASLVALKRKKSFRQF